MIILLTNMALLAVTPQMVHYFILEKDKTSQSLQFLSSKAKQMQVVLIINVF